MIKLKKFTNLIELVTYFKNEKVCINYSKDVLLVYNGILEMKYEIKNMENLIKEHKDEFRY